MEGAGYLSWAMPGSEVRTGHRREMPLFVCFSPAGKSWLEEALPGL